MTRTRTTWGKAGTWIAGTALATLLALTGYSLLGGEGNEARTSAKDGAPPHSTGPVSPGATYEVPRDWTEPERWTVLPRGERVDERGSQVGYPHTRDGAVAMLAATSTFSAEGDQSIGDEQTRIFRSYVVQEDQTAEKAARMAEVTRKTDAGDARRMGIAPGEPFPPGAYIRTVTVGYEVVFSSDDEVGMWLLARTMEKTGETARETTAYIRAVVGARWEDSDWRMSGDVGRRTKQAMAGRPGPRIAAPGDARFNSEGWTAIRAAS